MFEKTGSVLEDLEFTYVTSLQWTQEPALTGEYEYLRHYT